jgi:hypothetical protein
MGEAKAALLAAKLAGHFAQSYFILEWDSLITIMAINKPNLIFD